MPDSEICCYKIYSYIQVNSFAFQKLPKSSTLTIDNRSQLPQDLVKSCVPHLIRFLRASSHVTHTYAAAAIEKVYLNFEYLPKIRNCNYFFLKILLMRVSSGTNSPALVTGVDLTPVAEPLLQGLFGAFELQSSNENEYVMKCIMRSFSTLQVV